MTEKVVSIDDYRPHITREVICIRCLARWVAVYPEDVLMKDLECPSCKRYGGVIATGQEFKELE